ncbi:hypothetical protein G3M48_004649 [Beauveria asiatica]|uniref:Uncharacterized protein n=1 Tax=Beauveria asiatica TaxID=1069075 RepID=A0AAW0RU63_9HYPO
MAIDQSFTPATGARGRRRFPVGFHHDAQNELMSSPVRRSTSAARNGRGQRRHLGKDVNPNAKYYGILANEEDETVDAFDAIDLESETRKTIAKEKERMTNRVDVLRTFVESIAACARKFDHGYAHAVADFTKSLLRHWNQFLHSGEIVGAAGSFATWAPARLIPSVASCLAAGADCAVAASGMDKLLDARNSISMRINAPNEMPVVYYRGSTLHDIITCLHTQTLQPSTAEVFYTVRRRCRDRYGTVPAPL